MMLAVAGLMLGSCQGEKKEKSSLEKYIEQPEMTLSGYDSTTVRSMCIEFLDLVKAGQVEDAITRLYILDGEKVIALPESQQEECKMALGLFEIYDYHIDNLIFHKETDTEVHYSLYLENPAGKSNPRKISGKLCPVRRDGSWYLTLANEKNDVE